MTAGRGIVHSEMPGWNRTRGLQLWVNLAAEFKMVEPAYQELSCDQIPEANENGVKVKVIAGQSMGVNSQVRTRTPTTYLDFKFQPGPLKVTSYLQSNFSHMLFHKVTEMQKVYNLY